MTKKIEIMANTIRSLPPPTPYRFASKAPLVTEQHGSSQPTTAPGSIATELGKIATAYFKKFTTRTTDVDTIFGIHDRRGRFYTGSTDVTFDADDTIMSDRVYEGTPELCELNVSETPSDEIYTVGDKENILIFFLALMH